MEVILKPLNGLLSFSNTNTSNKENNSLKSKKMVSFTIVGNLTKDAEARQVGERYAIGLSIAVNRKSKSGTDIVTYFNVIYWCKSDKVAQYLTKGQKIVANGSWYDNKEGKDGRWYQTFHANEIVFGFDGAGNRESKPQQPKDSFADLVDGDDDLPF